MFRVVGIVVAAVGLAGCAGSLAEQAFAPQRTAAREDQTCRAYGAIPGTARYQDCRLQLAAMRTQQNNVVRMQMMEVGLAMMGAPTTTVVAPPPLLVTPPPPPALSQQPTVIIQQSPACVRGPYGSGGC